MHKRKKSLKTRLTMNLNGAYLSSKENLKTNRDNKGTKQNEHPLRREVLPLISADTDIGTTKINEISEEEIEEEELSKAYLLFEKKEINIFKLYWHLSTWNEKIIFFFAIITSFIVGAHISFINYLIALAEDEFDYVITGEKKIEDIVENEKKTKKYNIYYWIYCLYRKNYK